MEENKYLNEEKYKRTERTIIIFAVLLLILGLSLGGFLIYNGVVKPGASKVDELKVVLEKKKSELEAKGLKYERGAEYTDGEVYDLKIVTEALDPSFDHCSFEEYKNNSITKEYCAAKNSTGEFASTGKIMIGGFICFTTLIFSGFMFMIAKRRSIYAFQAQQVMPVAKEGINEMAPTLGNAAGEIAKGVKKGLDDNK